MINNNPYKLTPSSDAYYNTDKTLKIIDKQIITLLNSISEDYNSGNDAKYLSVGILNDRNFLYRFGSNFSKPNINKPNDEDAVPDGTILPKIYYEYSWLNETIVLETIEAGYRIDIASGIYNVSIDDKLLHAYLDETEERFDDFKKMPPSDIKIHLDEQLDSLEIENRFLYYKIYDVLHRLPKDLRKHKLNLARLLFQWASGTILNFFLYQYKLSDPIINKYLDTNLNWQSIIDIDGLNNLRLENSRRLLLAIMSKYVLWKKKDFKEPVYKSFINEMDHQELKVLYEKKKELNSNDKRGSHNKDREIIPEPNLWKEAKKYFQKHGEDCLSSKDKTFPNSKMKKYLAGEMSNLELYGYEKRDKKKKNPIKLKAGKIRELLGENNDKWKIRK